MAEARMRNKKRVALPSEHRTPHSEPLFPAFIGLGSNVGDRLALCREAVRRLGAARGVQIRKISSLYETDPVDYLEQNRFYNAVIAIETSLSPDALLEGCREIEHQLGKKIVIPKGPRTMDLDLLFYDDRIMNEPGLQIPHPGIPNRAFVLIPLVELAPDFIHPERHASIADLLHRLETLPTFKKIAPPGWEKTPLAANGPA